MRVLKSPVRDVIFNIQTVESILTVLDGLAPWWRERERIPRPSRLAVMAPMSESYNISSDLIWYGSTTKKDTDFCSRRSSVDVGRDGVTKMALLISAEADWQICGSAVSMQEALKQVATADPRSDGRRSVSRGWFGT